MNDEPEKDEQKYHYIRVARRPWYIWLAWMVWLLLEIFFLQNALASHEEFEDRAAAIYWMIFGVLLLGGVIVWIVRQKKL